MEGEEETKIGRRPRVRAPPARFDDEQAAMQMMTSPARKRQAKRARSPSSSPERQSSPSPPAAAAAAAAAPPVAFSLESDAELEDSEWEDSPHRSPPSATKRRKTSHGKSKSKSSEAAAGAAAAAAGDEPYEEGPVYDTCNEVRRKIRAYLRTGESTIAAFLRACGNISHNSYQSFMSMKMPMQGSGNCLYPAAYHFFEKRRLAAHKPKSKLRLESEEAFPEGHSLEPYRNRCWVYKDEVPVVNRLGQVHIMHKEPRPRKLTAKQLEQMFGQA
jgi:hypothetical protein